MSQSHRLNYRVNYDAVAPTYDGRVQAGYLGRTTLALQALARQVKARQILDLGCGTGRSLHGWPDELEPVPLRYGLDFSAGMLAQARTLDLAYRLVRASAPHPPFAPGSFEMVFCTHAFHHFPDKPQVVQAAYTLLRPGGVFAIVNFDPHETPRSDWPIYEYFEGTYETDLQRFPSMSDQEAMLQAANFQQVESPIVEYYQSELSGEAIFDNYHLRKDASSQLILISDEAYQAGLRRMRERIAAAEASGETATFRTYLKNRICYGLKPAA